MDLRVRSQKGQIPRPVPLTYERSVGAWRSAATESPQGEMHRFESNAQTNGGVKRTQNILRVTHYGATTATLKGTTCRTAAPCM
jgi:hypothetical protein